MFAFKQISVDLGPIPPAFEAALARAQQDLEHDSRLLLFDGKGGLRDLSYVHPPGTCDTCDRREPVFSIRWGNE